MSVKYILLGGLMFSCSHGYEIKSQLTQKMFGEFGINDGQLYPTLKKLEADGRENRKTSRRRTEPPHLFDHRPGTGGFFAMAGKRGWRRPVFPV